MIPVLGLVFQKYLETPFQMFTEKFISAIGVLEILDEDIPKEDSDRIKFIEENTNKKLFIPIYSLDRVINPSQESFNSSNQKFKFPNNDKQFIELKESQIQYYLCMAIREVHNIVMRNMQGYKIEQNMSKFTEESENIDKGVFNV